LGARVDVAALLESHWPRPRRTERTDAIGAASPHSRWGCGSWAGGRARSPGRRPPSAARGNRTNGIRRNGRSLRCQAAWTTWGQHETAGGGAGSAKAILTQLKHAGFPVEPTGSNYWTTGAFLVNHNGWLYQLVAGELTTVGQIGICLNRQDLTGAISGSTLGFTLDARDQFYSHFCLIFLEDVVSLTDTDCPAKARLNAVCKRWKSGSAIYNGCVVVPQENSAICWGYPHTTLWGQADLVWGTNGARFINPE
jgi:hypothetical protein